MMTHTRLGDTNDHKKHISSEFIDFIYKADFSVSRVFFARLLPIQIDATKKVFKILS